MTTKLWIVYDGSARDGGKTHSLNDLLKTGHNYIPMLLNTLPRFCTHPVAVVADMEKAFLMMGISNSDWEVLHFLWFKDPFDVNSEIIHQTSVSLMTISSHTLVLLYLTIDKYANDHPQLRSQSVRFVNLYMLMI